MVKKQGFTLIELLAVIVILSIIAVMTVPVVLGIIDRAQISSYKESVRSVFDATSLYLASNEFQDLPAGGIPVTDARLQIKNKEFTSGKIIKNEEGNLELDKVSNGRFCAGGTFGNISIIEGSCDQLDITPPTIYINSNLITSNSVTIVATSEDLESGINGYQFSKDNGTTWTTKQTSNFYTFLGLTNGIDYNFKIRVFNNNDLASTSDTLIIRTSDIAIPTYSIDTTDWSSSKVVTITYPARQAGYVYEYSLDNALTWETVVDPAITKDITFNTNGNVIARIFDGTNEISGASYAVTNIDTVSPTVVINLIGTPFNASGWAKVNFDVNIQTTDTISGINHYAYCQTTSATCTPTTVISAESGNVTISTESATNKVCAQAFDNANNSSVVVCSSEYKLDKTSPTVPTTMGMTFSDGITNYTNNTWTNNSVYMYGGISGSTDTGGVAKYQISSDNATWSDYVYNSGNALYGLTTDGTQYRYARAVDNAGNVSSSLIKTIKIDKTAPTVPTTMGMTLSDGTTNYTNNAWTNNSIYMYGGISGSTDTSGISKYQISSDNAIWVDYAYVYTNPLYGLTTDGTQYRYARAVDNAGNVSGSLTKTIKIDKTLPAVVFGTNGNATYAKSRSTTVTISDSGSGLLSGSLKYLWNTSTATPAEVSFTTTFTSGATLTTPTGVTGSYYLWILSKDNAGNTTITRTNVFNLDNIIPVITVSPTTLTIYAGSTYTDTGVTATDNINGTITASVVKTGTVNTSLVGSYILTYNVSDTSGNAAAAKTRTVNVINSTFTFTNTGLTGMYGPNQTQLNTAYAGTTLAGMVTSSAGIQLWTVPYTGTYRIETWGAKGGGTAGGLGARMRGDFNLTAGQVLKILVGQLGKTVDNTDAAQGSGGSFVTLNDNTPLIVAGGGGGNSGGIYSSAQPDGQVGTTGGYGRDNHNNDGTPGTNGSGGNASQNGHGGGGFLGSGTSGTQGGQSFIIGGIGGFYEAGLEGGFGGGGATAHTEYPRGGGGGGYSGGGGARADSSSTSYATAGGGGSYNSGTNQSNTGGANSGSGSVVITIVP